MVRIIYGDVLLLIDFCMNFFVLYTASLILRRRIKWICVGLASLIGGIYSVAKVFLSGNDIIDCIISLCVGLLVCYICFGGYRFIKTAAVFYCVSALVGGIMFGIYYFLGSYHNDIYGYAFEYAYSHLPIWLFIVLAAVSMTISWAFAYLGRESTEKGEDVIIIEHQYRKAKLRILLDSGNLAKEPISGKSVVMISKKKAKELFEDEMYSAIIGRNTEKLLKNKFRLITVSGLDGKESVYFGFFPDKMYVLREKQSVDIDAYVIVCDTEFFGGCEGIAHPALLT